MSSYIRRFTTDPGNAVLLNIESINVLDLTPPSAISGVGTGTACLFGEFENGPYNTPTEVASSDDYASTFGVLGYAYGSTTGNNPCARSRKADAAVNAEFWNGNGFVQLNGKHFSRLVLVRVDTSVGTVAFSRLASVSGAPLFAYPLATGQVLSLAVDGGGPSSATFTGVAATITGAAGTFAITGGETLVLGYDAAANFTVGFLSGDNSVAGMVARINTAAGFAFAVVSGGQIKLTGRQGGTGGQVRVVSGTASGAISGLTVANTAGTGNVANISAVTPTELKTIVEAGVAGTLVESLIDGTPRISSTTGLAGTITVGTATTATALGFVIGATDTAAAGNAGVIPAGTVVATTGGLQFVTTQDVTVTAAAAGPYTVKVRHALDDGTGTGTNSGTIVKILTPFALDSFSVVNLVPASAALAEAALDAVYQAAYDSTLDVNTVAHDINITWSARQSNACRRGLRSNAITASANGLLGRIACIRPPLGTTKQLAVSLVSEPGPGAYRSDRVVYNYPGFSTFVPQIGLLGLAGGAGFTANGNVDVGADGFCASIMSQLAPEENPAQTTDFLSAVVGLESSPNAQGFGINDYIAFKAAGVCAARIDQGVAGFQSGVTCVDPITQLPLKNIARRRMADFIEDSMALSLKDFGKKLSTVRRRVAIVGEIKGFLAGLLSLQNPSSQRIAGYLVDAKSGNTPTTLAQGIYRVKISVRTLSSLDSIVLESLIGEQVDVNEIPQAA